MILINPRLDQTRRRLSEWTSWYVAYTKEGVVRVRVGKRTICVVCSTLDRVVLSKGEGKGQIAKILL
jgi:hypothetical protein